MTERPYLRELDDPSRFERESVTRIMPQDARELGLYVLRIMMPPGSETYAVDYLTCLLDKEDEGSLTVVGFMISPSGREEDLQPTETAFNRNGFMIIENPGQESLPDMPEEIEMGYIVGSSDEFDIGIAQMTGVKAIQSATELLRQRKEAVLV